MSRWRVMDPDLNVNIIIQHLLIPCSTYACAFPENISENPRFLNQSRTRLCFNIFCGFSSAPALKAILNLLKIKVSVETAILDFIEKQLTNFRGICVLNCTSSTLTGGGQGAFIFEGKSTWNLYRFSKITTVWPRTLIKSEKFL